MLREEALAVWEEMAKIFEKALVKVITDLDAKREKAEATQKEYLDKMEAHTVCGKHSLNLDKKVELDGRE
jgi:GTP1/Obg family GTP-binding protein